MLLHVIDYDAKSRTGFAIEAAKWVENAASGHIINVYSDNYLKPGITYSFVPTMFWEGDMFIRAELDYKKPHVKN